MVEAWVEAGENGAVPAVARVELLGDVRVPLRPRVQLVGEERAAAAAVEDKIKKAIVTDDVKRDWYNAWLSEMSDEPGSEWMADLPDVGPETVGELALVDVDNRKLAMALTGASQYHNARKTLWLWKGAAVALLGEKLADNPPPMEKHAERPAKHQHVPDGVANRFVAWLIGRFSHRSSIRLIAG